MTREKRLLLNSISSVLYQVTAIVCGFVVPRLILQTFGSEVNGLVNSIAQFLGVISFLELGVGSVVQSALYQPLAQGDWGQVSRIMASAQRFFGRLALILLGYVAVLLVVYPRIAEQSFGLAYIAGLIAAISINSFAQYYFGVANRLLLLADQHGYVSYSAQTAALLVNTMACILLIRLNATIHMVKLTSSLIFLIQPISIAWYVKRHYRIDRRIRYEGEPIRQKWNGVAQHVAAVVLDGTDYIVLTVLGTLSDVSIYSVYHLVVNGVKQVLVSATNGVRALLGELWARKEADALHRTFAWTEWTIHTGTTLFFGIAGILIVPFVRVYTSGITDADYIQPLFAALLVAANAGHCLRLPYNLMILAAGHYKQTQSCHIVGAALNVAISVATVKWFGLVGVAIGTLTAMLYQTVWMAAYGARNLVRQPLSGFFKQAAVDIGTVVCMYLATRFLVLDRISYLAWVVLAVKTSLISAAISVAINLIFYRERVKTLYSRGRRRLKGGERI